MAQENKKAVTKQKLDLAFETQNNATRETKRHVQTTYVWPVIQPQSLTTGLKQGKQEVRLGIIGFLTCYCRRLTPYKR